MTPREEAIIRAAYADGLQTGWAISEYDGDINTSGLADEYINEAIADNGGTAAQMICTDAPDDDHKAALAEKEAELKQANDDVAEIDEKLRIAEASLLKQRLLEHKVEADYERITTLQMNQNRRQEAELEKARELLRRGKIAAQFMANDELDSDIAAYLGEES